MWVFDVAKTILKDIAGQAAYQREPAFGMYYSHVVDMKRNWDRKKASHILTNFDMPSFPTKG